MKTYEMYIYSILTEKLMSESKIGEYNSNKGREKKIPRSIDIIHDIKVSEIKLQVI